MAVKINDAGAGLQPHCNRIE
ncbi:Protein of unknown function [Bacillus cereus]|nr:Protein of unknown function [Bacillus cereus]